MTVQNTDKQRIQRRLDYIWDIGHTEDGGVTRLAYSDEETEAIEYICSELDDEFEIRTDPIGNVFASQSPEASQSFFLGSHLDSVFNGGRLDGTLGVITALEAIEVALETGDPPIPPTLVIFRAEESTRFGQWAIGSRGAFGQLTVEDFSSTDQSGIPLWQAMQQQGFQPKNLSEPTFDTDRAAGFLELHIEQGRVLDEQEKRLGVVTSIRAPVRYQIRLEGAYDHSGATPMNLRGDAIGGAAEMIQTIEETASNAATDGDIVATVGDITAYDGAINKVCGEVSFPLDIRSNDLSYRNKVETSILDRLRTIAEERELKLNLDLVDRSDPVNLDTQMTNMLEELTRSIDTPYRRIPSGGGHDAMIAQHANVPTGMLFVPSVQGISHSPKEATHSEAIQSGSEVLAQALLEGPPATINEE